MRYPIICATNNPQSYSLYSSETKTWSYHSGNDSFRIWASESFEEVVFEDFVEDFGFNDTNNDLISSIDFSQSDSVYIDSDGNQVVYKESSDTYALCTHSMVPSSFYTHGRNSSGGCTVKIYSCQRCEKCGYRANAVYQNTITYAKCPH